MNLHSTYHRDRPVPLFVKGLSIIEPPIITFDSASSAALGYPFQKLEEVKGHPKVIISLPYNLLLSKGKGYVLELQDFAKGLGFVTQVPCKVRWHQFGACIHGLSLLLVCSKAKWTPPKSVCVTETPVAKILPNIITFAPKFIDKVLFTSGSGGLNGFLKSTDQAFPALTEWGKSFLLCEKEHQSTVRITRVAPAELSKVLGADVEGVDDLPALRSVVPMIVYATFIHDFLKLK